MINKEHVFLKNFCKERIRSDKETFEIEGKKVVNFLINMNDNSLKVYKIDAFEENKSIG